MQGSSSDNSSALPYDMLLGNDSLADDNQTFANETAPTVSLTRAMLLGFTLGAFISVAIVGNIMVIISVVTNKQLRIPTNYLIVNLAIADLLLSSTVLPFSATNEIVGYWVFGRILCDVWAAMDVLCCTASIFSLCTISIDRYIGVRHSLRYPTIVTRKRAILALLGVWIFSTVISIGPLLGWKEPAPPDTSVCKITTEIFYAIFSSLASFYIPLIVILVMYCRVYVVAKRITKNLEAGVIKEQMDSTELTLRIHCRNMQNDSPNNSKVKDNQPRSSLSLKLLKFSREKKAAKTLGIVVGMFIFCWLPFFTVLPLSSLSEYLTPAVTLEKIIFWLAYFNSCINPIIYPCSSKEFKRAFLRILRCQWGNKKPSAFHKSQYQRRPGSAVSHSRKGSIEETSQFIKGNQRTILTNAPNPRFLRKANQPKENRTLEEKHPYFSGQLDYHESSEQDNPCSVFSSKGTTEYNEHSNNVSVPDALEASTDLLAPDMVLACR